MPWSAPASFNEDYVAAAAPHESLFRWAAGAAPDRERGMKTNRWNHNLHYHPLILAAAPAHCARALDVGCGEGVLTRELRSVSDRVVGIDLDSPSIESARAQGGEGVEYVLGNFLKHQFQPASFDLVASVAALHHMDAEAGLTRMSYLVRPGGARVVVGLAQSRQFGDFALDVAGAVATRVHTHILRKRYWEHDAPKVWPPPLSYGELRATAARLLPGVKYRRQVLWRYSLVWIRPGS
jgi:SAM-dependent methyltransferase